MAANNDYTYENSSRRQEEDGARSRGVVDKNQGILQVLMCWRRIVDVSRLVYDSILKKLFSMLGKIFPAIQEYSRGGGAHADHDMVDEFKDGELDDARGALNESLIINRTKRGVGVGSTRRSMGEEEDLKMERFKVKTLNLGGAGGGGVLN